MSKLYSVILLTYKDKRRHFSFLAFIYAMIFLTYFSLPDNAPLLITSIQPKNIIQGGNPTWLPILSALGLGWFLPLGGFFYFKTNIQDDHANGTAQLIHLSNTPPIIYLATLSIRNRR